MALVSVLAVRRAFLALPRPSLPSLDFFSTVIFIIFLS